MLLFPMFFNRIFVCFQATDRRHWRTIFNEGHDTVGPSTTAITAVSTKFC